MKQVRLEMKQEYKILQLNSMDLSYAVKFLISIFNIISIFTFIIQSFEIFRLVYREN